VECDCFDVLAFEFFQDFGFAVSVVQVVAVTSVADDEDMPAFGVKVDIPYA
jgi:hypothetical protein